MGSSALIGYPSVISDEADLPYVSSVVSECYRWLPVAPMGMSYKSVPPLSGFTELVRVGVPHAVSSDDTYKGYSIP
jgi:hypothetical protein